MKQSSLFLPHYEPFLGCGTTMKIYCNTHGLDDHQFRKWRIHYEQSNKLPITYNARSAKCNELKKGITPLQTICDSTPKEQITPSQQVILAIESEQIV